MEKRIWGIPSSAVVAGEGQNWSRNWKQIQLQIHLQIQLQIQMPTSAVEGDVKNWSRNWKQNSMIDRDEDKTCNMQFNKTKIFNYSREFWMNRQRRTQKLHSSFEGGQYVSLSERHWWTKFAKRLQLLFFCWTKLIKALAIWWTQFDKKNWCIGHMVDTVSKKK